ncbi:MULTISPECIES: glycoside hydrolase family 95 protein [Niastella]|uniref:Glycoside hydrolase family 95 protein n=1 Tax=Niastella soli TaxID=2821487 RepID=A0ABS3Z4Q1_9BACT|nr:glycoside hydrolase family 95 protein [Niastella soli]MBO9205145.1 glycoside hydrolase family 95 protein [Niastella soli]
MPRCLSLLIFSLLIINAHAQQHPLRLWYDAPAAYWEASVPLGNGRLGAMPDGGLVNEHIVLNDITLWSGAPQDADLPGAYQYLDTIQQLLFAGKNVEAQEVMASHFICKGVGSARAKSADQPYGSYQLLGNLGIHYDYGVDTANLQPVNYKRELSLDNAIATTTFAINKVTYNREYFTSFDDDVIAIRLSASQLQKINCILTLNRPERFETSAIGNTLQMVGQLNNGTDGKGMLYKVKLQIQANGGQVIAANNSLQIKNANSAIIYLSAGTNYKAPAYAATIDKLLAKALQKNYTAQRATHINKYQQLFQRASLTIEGNNKDNLPTDKRLEAFVTDSTDNGLPVLYFQFGRYLLIGSTRAGLLPPNLQGLWANTIQTPWNGDYHLNINIQMNHWPLEVTNLSMLNDPFFGLVKRMIPNGEKTAQAYYKAKGWVSFVLTNIWQFTSPGENYSWGSFNTGSAWLCQMLYNHYEFTQDTAYLRKLYPILKGSAEFYLSTLVKEPSQGWLVTAPSNSPENAFVLPDGRKANVCEGPTMDNQIIRFLFTATADACDQLHIDADFKQALQKTIVQLPPNQIGKDGRLMEWLKEYQEAEPHHRHVSHLWGLYPASEINMGTPALANAARATLVGRGDEGTGWSLAWKMNLWARLHDGDHAFLILQRLLRPVRGTKMNFTNGGGTYANLFCAHPPYQIDGNFGGTAGIAEMLIQSQDSTIELLPALPHEWKKGHFSGLCVRGGAEVSAAWNDGQVREMTILATKNRSFVIRRPKSAKIVRIKKNNKILNTSNDTIRVNMHPGETIQLFFEV